MDAISAAYGGRCSSTLACAGAWIEDAQDFTRIFSPACGEEFLDSYDPDKGRLRTFLRTCADRLFLNQERHANRLKRGAARSTFP